MQMNAEMQISAMLAADAMDAEKKENYIKFDFIYIFFLYLPP
jgi:hypothetical protein